MVLQCGIEKWVATAGILIHKNLKKHRCAVVALIIVSYKNREQVEILKAGIEDSAELESDDQISMS